MRLTRAGIGVFVLAVAAGPLYTVPGYSPVSNLISELAAQHTTNNVVMSAAFVALGGSIVADARQRPVPAIVPFAAFGFFMALVGLFGHKPITPGVDFDPMPHQVHSVLATLAGVSITFALAWQAVREPAPVRRSAAGAVALLCLALPLAMLAWPAVQGLIQRIMYAVLLAWLWASYPARIHA